MIITETHYIAHLGTEWVLNLIRRKFWIIKARVMIKKISRNCTTCKRLYGSPCQQKMANLPPERCDPGKAPFSYTGIDCFGTFYVRQGRSEIKRYGCVFTCLMTRALHIEKLNNMDTDSFLNGLIRFGSRRGWPEKMWSDNGTNFVGGQSELSRTLKDIEWKKIHNFCLRKEVNWSFNPPGASHMGGIWELMNPDHQESHECYIIPKIQTYI